MTNAPQTSPLGDDETVKLNTWLHDMEEGTLTEADHAAMEELLLGSEPARRYAVQRLGMGAALCRLADEAQEAGEGEPGNVVPLGAMPSTSTPAARRAKTWPMSARLALAASVAFCAVALALRYAPMPPAEVPVQAEVTDQGCAVLVDVAGAQWEEDSRHWQAGMSIPAGKFRLKAGLARLEFYSGASVTLEGKSELEIVSVNSARFRFGQMRVQVPPHARGFRLVTPDADVVDLGTEFGLKVTEAGRSEVHVFNGEVEVYPGSGTDKLSLKTGALWNAAHGPSTAGADALAFPDFASLHAQSQDADTRRRLAWREGLAAFLSDPRLLVGYTFEPVNAWDRTLKNQQPDAPEATHGSIVGAQWSQGRWQGKRALEFKSPGDRVRLAVAGEYQAITLAAWVQVGGVDRRFNSLFLTDTWEVGNPHWQFVQDGSFALGIRANLPGQLQHIHYSPKLFGPENLGVWFHLASTFDLRTGIGRHYINGRKMSEHQDPKVGEGTRILIGSGELGNWGLPEGLKPRTEVRSFNGRMDEFLMFREALEPAEISRLYEIGRPN